MSTQLPKSRPQNSCMFRRPFRRCDPHEIYNGHCHSSPQVEVFQFQIDKFDDIERGELYGKIEVSDLDGCLTLYHRDREFPEHICANSTLSLIGFPRSILNVLGFGINIDLRLRSNNDDNENDSNDVVLGKWQFSWDIKEPEIARIAYRGSSHNDYIIDYQCFNIKDQKVGYDQPLCSSFEGPNGRCITMYYALFKHAAQAWIQLEVVHMTDESAEIEFDARGIVTSRYSHFEYGDDSDLKDRCKTSLFETKGLESVKIKKGSKIKQLRSIIAVPLYASLVVEAKLWSDSDFKIAQGKVEFISSHIDLAYDYIRGDDDIAVRVMVGWLYGSKIPGVNPF